MSGVAIQVDTRSESAERDLKKINDSLLGIKKTTDKVSGALGDMAKSLAIGAVSIGSFAAIVKISDQFTDLGNKIALVTGRTKDMVWAQKELLDITERTRGAINGSATAFGTFGRALKASGASVSSMLKATEAIQQAVAISGSSADSANAAIVQLGQGLGAGVLRGEEFNSVLEQTPRIAMAIADSLGVTIGQLRAIANEGKLTSQVVFKGLLSQVDTLNKEFSTLAPTMSQGMTQIKQSTSEWINELLTGLGISDSLGTGLIGVAKRIRASAQTVSASASIFMADIRMVIAGIAVIAKPLGQIFSSIGDQIKMAMPKFWISRTLVGDVTFGLHKIDVMFNHFFSQTNRDAKYFFEDMFSFNTPIEKAIKQLRRLTPTNWITEGFNSGDLAAFFNTDTLYKYGAAMRDLAKAVADNTDSMFASYRNFGRKVSSLFTSIGQYIGFIPDTLVRLRIGAVDPLMMTISAIIRGITGMAVKITDVKRKVNETIGDTYIGVINAMVAAILEIPKILIKSVIVTFNAIVAIVQKAGDIVSEAWNNKFYGPIALLLIGARKLKAAFGDIGTMSLGSDTFSAVTATAITMAVRAGQAIKDFAVAVIGYFFQIYDDVIAHSWWTDLIEDVVSTSQGLLGRVKGSFGKFKDFIIGGYKDILDGSKGIFDPLKNLGAKYLIHSMQRSVKFDLTYDPTMFQKFMHEYDKLVWSVTFKSVMMADQASKAVRKFAIQVIALFKWIWDAVIGHSWWTDTMDGVVNQANSLTKRASKGLNEFKDFVSKIFRSLTGQATLGDKLSANLSGMGQVLGIVADDFKDKLSKAFNVFKEELPDIAKIAALSLAGLGLLIFPLGAMTGVLTLAVVESLITASTLVAEKFSQELFGTSFTLTIATALGKAIGYFTVAFIKELPQILNAFMGIVTGFTKGFLSQIPILGTALGGLINMTGGLLGNPLGLIAAYFFGKGIYPLIKDFGLIKTQVKWITTAGEKFAAFRASGGVLSTFLFGTLGSARLIGAIGLTLSGMGGFDSILGDSFILKTAANGGLLAMMIFGDKAAGKVYDFLYAQVVVRTVAMVKKLSESIQISSSFSLYDVLFGTNGETAAFLVTARDAIVKRFNMLKELVVEYGAKYGQKAIDVGKLLLFGTNEGETYNKFKATFQKMVDAIKDGIKKIAEFAMKSDFLKNLFTGGEEGGGIGAWLKKVFSKKAMDPVQLELNLEGAPKQAGFDFKQAGDQAEEAVQRVRTGTDALTRRAAEAGGETGILGRVFFGRYGRLVVVGLALLAFAGMAKAADATSEEIGLKNYSVLDGIMSNIKYYFTNDPITAWLVTIGGAMSAFFLLVPSMIVPAFTTAAVGLSLVFGGVFRRIAAQITLAFALGPVEAFAARASAAMASLSAGWAAARGGLAGAAIGGGAAAALGGSTTQIAIAAALSAGLVQVWAVLPATITAALTTSLVAIRTWSIAAIASFGAIGEFASTMWAAILGPVGIVIAAVVGLGAIFVSVFGEGQSFAEKLDDVFRRMLVSMGLLGKGATVLGDKLDKAIPSKDRKFGVIDIKYSFKDVDFTKVNKQQKESATNLVEKLAEATTKAQEEQTQLGEVSKTTADNVASLNKAVNNIISKLEAATRKDLPESLKDANASNQTNEFSSGFGSRIKQSGLDKEFIMAGNRFKEILKTDQNNEAALKGLKDLQGQRNKLYKADYLQADEFTKQLQGIYDQIDGDFNIAGDPNMSKTQRDDNSRLAKRFSESTLEVEKANKAFAEATVGFFGPFSGKDPNYDAAKTNRDSARASVMFDAKQILAAQTQEKAIQSYQKSLGDLETQLTKIGVSFEENPMFASGVAGANYEYGIDGFKAQAAALELLVNASKRAKDSYESLDLYLQTRDARAGLVLSQRQGADKNTLNPDQLVSKSFEKAGVSFDAKTLGNTSASFRLLLSNMAQSLEASRAKLNLKDYIITENMSEEMRKSVSEGLDAVKAEIQAKSGDINKKFVEAFSTSDTAFGRNQIVSGLGIQTPEDVQTNLSPDRLKEYQAKEMQLKFLKDSIGPDVAINISDKDFDKVKKGIQQLTYELTTMTPLSQTASASLERLSRINFSVTSSQLKNIPLDVFSSLSKDAERFKAIQDKLDNPAGLGLDEIKKLGEEQAKLRRKGEEAQAKYVPRSFNDRLSSIGSAGLSIDMATALKLPPGTVDAYTKIADQMAVIQRQANDPDVTTKQIEELAKKYLTTVKALRSVTEATSDYSTRLGFVNAQFAEAKVTPDEWARMQDAQRKSLYKLAQETRDYNEVLEESRDLDPEKAKSIRKNIMDNNKQAMDLGSARNSTKSGADLMTRAGVNTDESTYGRVSTVDRVGLEKQAKDIIAKSAGLDRLDTASRILAEQALIDMRKGLTKGLQAKAQATGQNKLDQIGMSIGDDAYNVISDAQRKVLDSMADAVLKYKIQLASGTLDESGRIIAQNSIDALNVSISNKISEFTMTRESTQAYQAGTSFASSIANNLTTGISDILNGTKSFKDFLLDAINNFTNSVINTTVDGFVKGFTGKGSMFESIFANLGEGLFGMAKGSTGGNTSQEDTFAATAMLQAATSMEMLVGYLSGQYNAGTNPGKSAGLDDTSWMSGINTINNAAAANGASISRALSASLGSMGGVITAGLQGLASILGAGGGGGGSLFGSLLSIGTAVYGAYSGGGMAGAGTVSAGTLATDVGGSLSSTDWMSGIKSAGSFAVGGVVPGTLGQPVPITAHAGEVILNAAQQNALLHGGSGKAESTFHLNVTGDISRQTRTEIQKMIPQIASGVNQHNYENGSGQR